MGRNQDQPWSYRYYEITLSCPPEFERNSPSAQATIWELTDPRSTLRRQRGSIPMCPANVSNGRFSSKWSAP